MAAEYFHQFGKEVQGRIIEQVIQGLGLIQFGKVMNWFHISAQNDPLSFVQTVHAYVGLCKSPIEALLLPQLVLMSFLPPLDRALRENGVVGYSWFSPQSSYGPYVIDFLNQLTIGGQKYKVAIECDGHAYHERTKEQAQHDKARDRYLLTRGIPTLRFTGSEIYKAPDECGLQIAEFLATQVPSMVKAA